MTKQDDAVIEVRHAGGALVIRLVKPNPTSTYAHKLRTALLGIAEHGHALRVILDLEELGHQSESLLGIFIAFDRMLRKNAGTLRLCSVSPTFRELLAATQTERLFSVYDSVEHATAD